MHGGKERQDQPGERKPSAGARERRPQRPHRRHPVD
jgi:hypothetical protein